MEKKEIKWIDTVKGYCMISVYLIHSEAYYNTVGTKYCFFLLPFYVNAFFFVSGYLFFLKNYNHLSYKNYKKQLSSIIFRLVIPTILFSSIIYIPKMLFHNDNVSLSDFFINVFGGISFWFTSALATAQFFLILLLLFRKNTLFNTMFFSFFFFIIGISINNNRQNTEAINYLPWYWKTGIVYVLILTLGGFYFLYEKKIDPIIKSIISLIVIVYVFLMFLYQRGTPMQALGMGGQCNLFGLSCLILGVILIVGFSKQIQSPKFIRYIGRNSIVFYFFSGAYPAFVSSIAIKLKLFNNDAINIFSIFVFAIWGGMVTTWFVKRYCNFLLDIRKIL